MHYTTQQELANVSYKTVVTALKESEPNIIKAALIPLADSEF
jgi:NACalpha-BTF3-like transcription factor